MTTVKSQFVQLTSAGIILVLIFGTLSMIWPGILALFLGVFLLLQSCGAEPEIVALSWTEVGHVPIAFAALRRSGLPSILW